MTIDQVIEIASKIKFHEESAAKLRDQLTADIRSLQPTETKQVAAIATAPRVVATTAPPETTKADKVRAFLVSHKGKEIRLSDIGAAVPEAGPSYIRGLLFTMGKKKNSGIKSIGRGVYRYAAE